MVAGGAPVQTARRRSVTFSGPQLDWWLALAALAIGLLIYLTGDRTNWSGGFGFDGRFYGELAKNFPSAVFGHGTVIQPGWTPQPYTGPEVQHGVDSYYVFRILPSGLVWLGLKVTTLTPTYGHIIGLFAALDAFMFALATWCWCRCAALLGLGDRERVLGTIALLINFAVLRVGGYTPVLTDQVALGLGALMLYLWLRGWTIALAVTVFLLCFTWPLSFLTGAVLLAFPAPRGISFAEGSEERLPWRRSWRGMSRFSAAVGALAGVAALVVVILLNHGGNRVSSEGNAQLHQLFPLSAVITAAFVFVVVGFFLPREPRDLWALVRKLQPKRIALAVVVVGAARIIGKIFTQRTGYDSLQILEEEFWWTTLDPGVFIVIWAGYFGPLLLALLFDLPRAARDSWRLGPGMALIVAIGVLGALSTQAREIANIYPFLLLPGVLAFRRIFGLGNLALGAFFLVALAWSRIWLYIGPIETSLTALLKFPAQTYYMEQGPWTTQATYAMQLGGVLLTVAVGAAWLGYQRRSRPPARPG
jgi:hypothetical protein